MHKRRNDIILVVVLVVLSLSALLIFNLKKSDGKSVSVLVDGKEAYSLPLSKNSETEIKSKGGSNILVIEDGKAFVKQASCPDKICKNHAKISKVGETIVCLPNRVTVKVTSKVTVSGLDAVV